MSQPPATLPARPHLRPGEDVASYLERTAQANHLTFRELTGLTPRARAWEAPSPALLARLATLTGTSTPQLEGATLRGAFPGMTLVRARTGRRYAGQPASCAECRVDTVAARLNIIVLCPRCECLLRDPCFQMPQSPGPEAVTIQREVLQTVHDARDDREAQSRLTRLESLMATMEHAVSASWPPLAPGESPAWRDELVHFLRWALQPGYVVARPPFVTATTLALTWHASATPTETRDLSDRIAIMSDPWMPSRDQVPRWPDADTGYDAVMDLILDRGVQIEHIPTIIRRPGEPIVLPEAIRAVRTAEAVILTDLAAMSREKTFTRAGNVAVEHAATINHRVARLARALTEDADTYPRLATYLDDLTTNGLAPLAARRRALRHLVTVPRGVIKRLPAAAANTPEAETMAAAWVWLDATLGRPAGGPHPCKGARALLTFDQDLNPEGRLTLRDWWQRHLEDAATATATTHASSATTKASQHHVS